MLLSQLSSLIYNLQCDMAKLLRWKITEGKTNAVLLTRFYYVLRSAFFSGRFRRLSQSSGISLRWSSWWTVVSLDHPSWDSLTLRASSFLLQGHCWSEPGRARTSSLMRQKTKDPLSNPGRTVFLWGFSWAFWRVGLWELEKMVETLM